MAAYQIERVGQTLRPDGVAIEARSGSAEQFAGRVTQAAEKGLAIILMSSDPASLDAGARGGRTRAAA